MSLTIHSKYKYFDSTVQRAEDRRQEVSFLPFAVLPWTSCLTSLLLAWKYKWLREYSFFLVQNACADFALKFGLSDLYKLLSVINKELPFIEMWPIAIICIVFCITICILLLHLAKCRLESCRFESCKYPYPVVVVAVCLKHENALNEWSISLSATPIKNINFC